MKKIAYLLVAFAVLVVGTSATIATTPAKKSSVKIIKVKNTTNFSIDEIYISATDVEEWGDDILDPDEILMPGETVEVEVDCGTWDVKLVAEDGSDCAIMDITLCGSAQWNIVADCN
jgi:hypothetical protein